MVRGLDEFSSFMDVEETKLFRQSISGEYPGIGAQVHKAEDEPLEVLRPIYGGPAYKAGILSGDRILEVDGARTDEIPIDEVTDMLKGLAESKVTLKVMRRGWEEPKEFVIERRMVEVPSVYTEALPGKIGYLQLQQFGERSADDFISGLDALEKEGLSGLIIDLRNNPGGLLDAAVRIVDQFVAGDLPIVTQKGRGKNKGSGEIVTPADPNARANYPIVILVNQRSASASEIVAGAMQDFGRATLIGKRTFGKGSVQRLIPLSSDAQKVLGGEGQLRLTVQYYFLPLGRCIHTIRDANGVVIEQGGVPPDIEVDADRIPAWRAEEKERLRTNSAVLDYVEKNWSVISPLFTDGDDHDPAKYPDFDKLQKELDSPAPREDLRSVLRFHIRRKLEDARGKEFACDFQEDAQLQRAILEILKKRGERPEDYPRYASLAAKPDGTKR
jgi:carboxyl-terminal processing protease